MALGSCTTRRSPRVNTPVNPARELDELAGTQAPAKRSNAGSDEASTEAPTPPEASTPPLIPPTSEDFFTKFMKVFMETTQAWEQLEPRECPLKARTLETYSEKSYMDCYHFCQQYEDYFKTSGATRMNRTLFTATFFRGAISLRWAQHKRRHERATPITWSEFKAFLQKDLGSSQAFIDSIWSKFRRDSQYQLEEARDWAFHLQHLQSILSEFDPIRTPNKLTMICYFRKGLKPSIKVEMELQDRESMDFEEMVQRAVNAEAKAGLRSSTMVRELDARCPRGHRPSHNTSSKVQSQEITAKKPRTEESRPKEAKSTDGKNLALPSSKSVEPGKTSRTDKRREYLEKKKKKRDQKKRTPATEDNANAVEVGEKKKRGDNRCYNCRKKGHFLRNCPEPPKN